MFRLTRAVRFAINTAPDEQLQSAPTNSFGGFPSLTGAGQYFELAVTLAGQLDPTNQYLLNIKDVDRAVRQRIIPHFQHIVRSGRFGGGANTLVTSFDILRPLWPSARLESVRLSLTPTLGLSILDQEYPMVRLSQKFEFSASHRLHNPGVPEEQNRATYGKCNNPHGHGHNYELQVTLAGQPDASGTIVNIPDFEKTVAHTIVDRFDHKNLNAELPEFRDLIPTVENIAMVIYRLLKPRFATNNTKLAAVTVWETPKTWCEYSE